MKFRHAARALLVLCSISSLAHAGVTPLIAPVGIQDFPEMCQDDQGQHFVATLSRSEDAVISQIEVYRAEPQDLKTPYRKIELAGATAYGRPAMAPLPQGCAVVFDVEFGGSWQIAFSWVKDTASSVVTFGLPDATNIKPVVARKKSVDLTQDVYFVVWEVHESGQPSAIYTAAVKKENQVPTVWSLLSESGIPSSNPSAEGIDESRLFVVWDATKDDNVDIYGRMWDNATTPKWSSLHRVTDDPRIERHADLASRRSDNGVNEVWIAWEAVTPTWDFHNSQGMLVAKARINNYPEQRIAVARWTDGVLETPHGTFEDTGPAWFRWEKPAVPRQGLNLLKRPRLSSDDAGVVWLTVRENTGSIWQPKAWAYTGQTWHGPFTLADSDELGLWRPTPALFDEDGDVLYAVQIGSERIDSQGEIETDVRVLPRPPGISQAEPALEPFSMPPVPRQWAAAGIGGTLFDLSEYAEFYSTNLERQVINFTKVDYTLYWGNLHEHTAMSTDGSATNPPALDLLQNVRDVNKSDFVALTDHGANLGAHKWAYTQEIARSHHTPGAFVSLLGVEWTHHDYGHRNLIFDLADVDEIYHRQFTGFTGGVLSPRDLWQHIEDTQLSSFIAIPHGLADYKVKSDGSEVDRVVDWTHVHEHHQPLAEIFQTRGSYEHAGAPRVSTEVKPGYFYQDALEDEVVIGVSASPDHGGTAGLTGVWIPTQEGLTPDSLFAAFRERRTFGTTGAKISLFVNSNVFMMGKKILQSQGILSLEPPEQGDFVPLRVRAFTTKPIHKIVIIRNNQAVHERLVNANEAEFWWKDFDFPAEDRLYYYVRVERADGEMAWSSPIWFLSPEEMDRPPDHTRAAKVAAPVVTGETPSPVPLWTWDSTGKARWRQDPPRYRYRLAEWEEWTETSRSSYELPQGLAVEGQAYRLLVQEQDIEGKWSRSGEHTITAGANLQQ